VCLGGRGSRRLRVLILTGGVVLLPVVRTFEEEVGDGFLDTIFVVREIRGVKFLYSVEDRVEWDVPHSKLYEETGLVAA